MTISKVRSCQFMEMMLHLKKARTSIILILNYCSKILKKQENSQKNRQAHKILSITFRAILYMKEKAVSTFCLQLILRDIYTYYYVS